MFDRINRTLARHSDLIVAFGVVLILAMIVIRIPPEAMDWLIATNIAVAAVVLLTALYVQDAMRLPSFPTILLLTTLFRLGLNIATTRLILLEADAGDIIFAFGDFVVGGNYVVGAVVFIVIVIVQFVVIARGSERVAEVSARFTLDAMPGKQMAIDADLRGGLIDAAEARLRRQSLERESKLYGAMDGAMKFVKGDAIAGIVISLINIIGGLIVGTMQQGMAIGEAAELYSLLTIGDGLVSQIPALLISVSAGLVVTRVAAGDRDEADRGSHVAREIFTQVLAQPRALAVAAVLLAGMGLLPGFPAEVFWVLASGAGVVALSAAAAGRSAARQEAAASAPQRFGPAPLRVALHPALGPWFFQQAEPRADALHELDDLRERLTARLGVTVPPIEVGIEPAWRGQPPGYVVLLYDAPIGRMTIGPDEALVPVSGDGDDGGQRRAAPWRRSPMAVVPAAQAATRPGALRGHGIVLAHLESLIGQHAADLVGVQEASDLLERLRQDRPELVRSVVPGLLSVAQFAEVLQQLLRDGVPVRDLRAIVESLARWAPRFRQDAGGSVDAAALADRLRQDLRGLLCAGLTAADGKLRFYSIDPSIEAELADATSGGRLALTPDLRRQLLAAFTTTIDPAAHDDAPAVVLVNQPTVRRTLAMLLAPALPQVVVLAYQDLAPQVQLEPAGFVMLKESDEVAAEA